MGRAGRRGGGGRRRASGGRVLLAGLGGILGIALSACASPEPEPPPAGPRPGASPSASAGLPVAPPPPTSLRSGVLAEVAGQGVEAEEVFPLLYLSHPDVAREAIRLSVIERLVAVEAARLGVEVDASAVAEQTDRALQDLAERVRARTTAGLSLEEYLPVQYGLSLERYREWLLHSHRYRLLLERLVLHELRQHPRVQVRLIRVDSAALADEILDKLRRGADFETLARSHSNDAMARRGGLYPALPVDVGYELLGEIEELLPGEFDQVRPVQDGDTTRYRVLQLLARLPAQPGSWADAREAVEKTLEGRGIDDAELDAWMRTVEARHRVSLHGIGGWDVGGQR